MGRKETTEMKNRMGAILYFGKLKRNREMEIGKGMAGVGVCGKTWWPHRLSSSNHLNTNCCYTTNTTNISNEKSKIEPITVTGSPPTFVSAPNRRIVAVGDLHGDVCKARMALNMAGLLSSHPPHFWTGGPTVLVQVGDILDRGEDEIAILSLLRSLDIQARMQGGAVFQVNGNHETMNVEGDFRYVDSGGFDESTDFLQYLNECDHDWEQAFTNWCTISQTWKDHRKMSKNHWDPWNIVKRQRGVIARSMLFQPGGPLACELARHPVVLKVDDWVFCHGGLLPHHVGYGIEKMNEEVSRWMRGEHGRDATPSMPFIATKGYDSVVWNRLYSRDTRDLEEYELKQIHMIVEETLGAVGAKGMVVGHTPQIAGVNCEYSCSIWRVDVGMSSGVLDSRPEVLEIVDNKARAIRSEGDACSELQIMSYI